MSILKQWRDTANRCPDLLMQRLIRDVADELQAALAVFNTNPDAEWLRVVNGLWARGTNIVSRATQMPAPTPPTAGAGKGTQVLFERAA